MAAITEIYLCKDGQKLREGKLELSQTITTKQEAEKDARARCESDSWVKKIAYYSVSDSGDFKLFYSYTNDKAVKRKAPPKRIAGASARLPTKPRKPPVAKKPDSLIKKVISVFK